MTEEFYRTFKSLLKLHEGVRRLPYDDQTGRPLRTSKGKITIGIGRNLEDNPLSDDEIDYLLRNDVRRAIEACHDLYGEEYFDALPRHRQLGLASMAFQMGGRRLSKFVKMNPLVLAGKWKEAAEEALKSEWAKLDTPGRASAVVKLFTQETL